MHSTFVNSSLKSSFVKAGVVPSIFECYIIYEEVLLSFGSPYHFHMFVININQGWCLVDRFEPRPRHASTTNQQSGKSLLQWITVTLDSTIATVLDGLTVNLAETENTNHFEALIYLIII